MHLHMQCRNNAKGMLWRSYAMKQLYYEEGMLNEVDVNQECYEPHTIQLRTIKTCRTAFMAHMPTSLIMIKAA